MPTKKRKYNARFPAGRIKKIMQTDEEVGKVAQAVPIIISRTLELFVESLLSKAMQVTVSRNAKTLSPSHVKQCILAESKFDFLRDLVKNIPDVSAAEEKEMMSAESSPNSSRFQDMTVQPQKLVREDSNSSSSCDLKTVSVKQALKDRLRRTMSLEEHGTEHRTEVRPVRTETVTSPPPDVAIDLSKKTTEEKPVRSANFYQETLVTEEVQHPSVITVNPSYTSPQPSTSYTLEPLKIEPVKVFIDKSSPRTPLTPRTPISKTTILPIVNIDFTKNLTNPEIKILATDAANVVGVPKIEKNSLRQVHRQYSKTAKAEVKKFELKPIAVHPLDVDSLNSGDLQIDEDYDT